MTFGCSGQSLAQLGLARSNRFNSVIRSVNLSTLVNSVRVWSNRSNSQRMGSVQVSVSVSGSVKTVNGTTFRSTGG
ncbi:hypothetical protein Hanom_Chr02g00136561 [Helianthus anomalus]